MMDNGGNDSARPGGSAKGRPRATGDSSLRARQKVIGAGLKRLFDDVVDEGWVLPPPLVCSRVFCAAGVDGTDAIPPVSAHRSSFAS